MNGKRIAAIIGLIGMAVCILCMAVSGFLPELKDLLWTLALLAFLISAAISLFFYMRKQEDEAEKAEQQEKDGP